METFVLSLLSFLVLLLVYKTFSVKLTQYRSGDIIVRVGWTYYRKDSNGVCSITDAFVLTVEEPVESKKLEQYVLALIGQHRFRQRPDETVSKRFLRRNFN